MAAITLNETILYTKECPKKVGAIEFTYCQNLNSLVLRGVAKAQQ